MMACLDVAYRGFEANGAAIAFSRWNDSSGLSIATRRAAVAEYLPGQFFRRELPILMALLSLIKEDVDVVIIDGYVWLGKDRPGLGAHLYEGLGHATAVVGVAKSSFVGATVAVPIYRGNSRRPLFVTAAGMDQLAAARHVQEMAGDFRIPTLLKSVDQLSRTWPD